jgi:TPP-dependent pyruvate/acetoin dehydrogenase alpha subunit
MKSINKNVLKKILYKMLLIRQTDLQIAKRYPENKMRCPTHLSIGQECVPSVVGSLTSSKDLCVSSHRSHAHYLGKGGSLKRFISELYGKSTGCSKGRGGSMHLTDLNAGFVGSTAIVSNSIPVGVGLSLSSKILGKKQITIIYLGDASIEEGVFFESLNFAIVKKIPVIFICENNFYSVYSPLSVRQPTDRKIYKMVKNCHIKSFKANGNFTNEVVSTFLKAKNFVENKGEPVFLEFQTYRWFEHCGPNLDDHLKYRNQKELAYWKKNDPIKILQSFLFKKKWINENEIKNTSNLIAKKINEAFKYAEQSPFPKKEDLFKYLYK